MTWKEDALRRRTVRQGGPTKEPRRLKQKKPTKKPWKVFVKLPEHFLKNGDIFEEEFCGYRASTRRQCEKWIEKQLRSYRYFDGSTDKYRIVGPTDG